MLVPGLLQFYQIHLYSPTAPTHSAYPHLCKSHRIFPLKIPSLLDHFYGPYKILERVGTVAYRLELPPESKVHQVFHVSLLKVGIPENERSALDLPTVTEDGLSMILPVAILGSRVITRAENQVDQVMLEWKGKDETFTSWEDKNYVKGKFLGLSLVNPCGQGSKNVRGNVEKCFMAVEEGGEMEKTTRMRRTAAEGRGLDDQVKMVFLGQKSCVIYTDGGKQSGSELLGNDVGIRRPECSLKILECLCGSVRGGLP